MSTNRLQGKLRELGRCGEPDWSGALHCHRYERHEGMHGGMYLVSATDRAPFVWGTDRPSFPAESAQDRALAAEGHDELAAYLELP